MKFLTELREFAKKNFEFLIVFLCNIFFLDLVSKSRKIFFGNYRLKIYQEICSVGLDCKKLQMTELLSKITTVNLNLNLLYYSICCFFIIYYSRYAKNTVRSVLFFLNILFFITYFFGGASSCG